MTAGPAECNLQDVVESHEVVVRRNRQQAGDAGSVAVIQPDEKEIVFRRRDRRLAKRKSAQY